ncbi:MAG TPA: hypothetical protein VMA36_00545 [Candidatus Limnocylindria bacterium]|nr:hypothetical protein [Candidatus Limnocylindria bacterium]
MIPRLFAAAALVVSLAVPLAARADDGVPPPGTVLTGTFDHPIDSRTSDVLEPFTLTGVASDDRTYRGGRIFGHLTRVVRATKNGHAEIDFVFDAYIAPTGRRYPMQGRAVDLRVPAKRDAPPVPLGVVGTGIVAMKTNTDVTLPPRTMVQLQVTP